MAEARERPGSIHLSRLLLFVVATAFVTGLIAVTGDVQALWPLYVIPILIAAFAYHATGAVVSGAISATLLALLVLEADLDTSLVPGLVIGITAFTSCGVVVGALAHRGQRHAEQLEDASILDPLTGVYKPQYLQTRITEEVRRSERYNLSCTLALARVDDIDEFTERFGRFKTELLLEHLADILRVTARTTDIVARHAPTTFAILLPAADIDGARAGAERIQVAVDKAEFEGDVLEPAVHCTVKVTTATYPDEAADRWGLVVLAEKRLSQQVAVVPTPSDPRPEPHGWTLDSEEGTS